MNKPTFSIIVPTFNRLNLFKRCLRSLRNQTYDKNLFEIIVVVDGSDDGTKEWTRGLKYNLPCTVFHIEKENKGRIISRNKGMELAKNDWICWCDSDDELVSTYLEVFAKAIEEHPDTNVFTAGTVVYNEKTLHSSLRDGFMPGVRKDGRGCDQFKSGGVSTGGFIFNRRLIPFVGFLPEAKVPYGGDDSFPAVATQRYPELAALYGQTESGQWKPFGNPWGDDWMMFYMLTRENVPVKINYHGYLQHIRQ